MSAAGIVLALVLNTATPAASTEQPTATLYAFFATWCVPCRVELPQIRKLHRKYKDRGLRVLLISEDAPSTAANVPAFLARFGIDAPWRLDHDSQMLVRYNPPGGLPFVALLDDRGEVAYGHAGFEPGDERELEVAIVDLLDRPRDGSAPSDSSYSVTTTSQALVALRGSRFDAVPARDGTLQIGAARIEVSGRIGGDDEQCEEPCVAATVRADGVTVSDEGARSNQSRDQQDLRLERALLDLRWRELHLSAGDAPIAFGHGVSLSLRRVDQLGVDMALRGGRADYQLGPLTLTVAGGWINSQNLDPILFRVVEEERDRLGGASLQVEIDEGSAVSLYGVTVLAPNAASNGDDLEWNIVGTASSFDLSDLRARSDLAIAQRRGGGSRRDIPWAAYGSLSFDLANTTTLLEAKGYRDWEIGRPDRFLLYSEPPTLEREDQQVPSSRDAIGGRLRTEWRPLEDTTFHGNILLYRFTQDRTSALEKNASLAAHGYAGGDTQLDEDLSLALAGGYRTETRNDGSSILNLWHVDADAAWAIHPKLALTLKLNHVSETKFLLERLEFVRGLAVLGLAVPSVVALSFLYGYSTEAAVRPTHYPAAELKIVLANGGEIRLFAGRLAGGRVCVSGSCRDLPPFEGVRLDLVVRR